MVYQQVHAFVVWSFWSDQFKHGLQNPKIACKDTEHFSHCHLLTFNSAWIFTILYNYCLISLGSPHRPKEIKSTCNKWHILKGISNARWKKTAWLTILCNLDTMLTLWKLLSQSNQESLHLQWAQMFCRSYLTWWIYNSFEWYCTFHLQLLNTCDKGWLQMDQRLQI